jgi:diadenylate cyclase
VVDFITNLINSLRFIFERLDWRGVLDIALVTAIIFGLLLLLRDTQAMALLRGILVLIALASLLTSLQVLPAFSYLVRNAIPALVIAIPVIFAPEIRRGLERLGRAGTFLPNNPDSASGPGTISIIVNSAVRLAERKHGALIVLQRLDSLEEYIRTGVQLNARVTTELLLQIFYPNTPLHDGAVIIAGSQILAASCVMPLSASGVLTRSPERRMGLRHRAALGISEVSDAVAVVVSEETGIISVVHGGRMIRRLDAERLENILMAFFQPLHKRKGLFGLFTRVSSQPSNIRHEDL